MPKVDNICVLGEWLGGKSDEGFRNFGNSVIKYWQLEAQVTTLIPSYRNSWDRLFFNKKIRKAVSQAQPKHVIYISPSNAKVSALHRLKSLRPIVRDCRMWIIALQEDNYSSFERALVPYLKPDGVITQSPQSLGFYKKIGLKGCFSPSGVNLDQFFPVEINTKSVLRKKYGISKNAFVLLHVGHVNLSRNLETLVKIAKNFEIYPLLVSSTSTPRDVKLEKYLENLNVKIIKHYLPNIEEVYQLADAYIFPTIDVGGAINVPLSVMEALACNLPVISTPFGGLVKMFQDSEGCFFYEEWDQLENNIKQVQKQRIWTTRDLVEKYSWKNVAGNILTFIQNNS